MDFLCWVLGFFSICSVLAAAGFVWAFAFLDDEECAIYDDSGWDSCR